MVLLVDADQLRVVHEVEGLREALHPREATAGPYTRANMARARIAKTSSKPTAVPGFDLVVLTVANRVQQRYAERMLDVRHRLGALPAGLVTLVIADPAGKRVGSGGSTLLCMAELEKRGLLRGRRTLLLHSGGDSRRLPSWSAAGKIWVPLGREGRGLGPMNIPALFDLVLAELSTITLPPAGGVLVASGDAALRLAHEHVALDGRTATALAFPAGADRAARHGVFVAGRDRRVLRTLQKPTRAELRAAGALDARGQAAVDSGIFFFPPTACRALLRGARAMLPLLARGQASLDLYQEIADALAGSTTRAGFVERFARGDARRARMLAAFHGAVHEVGLRVSMLAAGTFLHLGSTRELVERLASDEPERMFPDLLAPLGPRARPHEPRLLLERGARRATCRTEIPVRGGRCTVMHGIDDDCKTTAEDGGTLCGHPLRGLPERTGLGERAIWGDDPHTLWHARIHAVAATPAPALVDWIATGRKAPTAWRAARRVSLAQLMSMADAGRMADEDFRGGHAPIGDPAAPLVRARRSAAEASLARTAAARRAARTDAMAEVGRAVSTDIPLPPVVRRFAVRQDQAVWASAPVRIDLAGGWSDTPPLCIEHGGAVVNAALTLGGTLPLQAMVRVTDEPTITLHSVDAGRTARYRDVRTLLDHHDPSQWDALPRAAIVLSGLVPRDPNANLRTHLERAGGGLAITLFSAVPRGSGLGTSSILGATLLATLHRVAGHGADPTRVARGASLLEQMIRTRGGWQDQVGGLWGGFKLATTVAGTHQVPAVAPLEAPAAFVRHLQERAILLYSGRRRMARGILETVVLRYLRGERAVLDARRRLVAGAHLMADAVRAGDLDEFALRLAEYRELKRTVDPASVTPDLEGPMAGLGRDLAAWSFAGAGGGGFLLLVCRSAPAAAAVRARLARHPAHPLARPFHFDLDPGGLRLAVL
jgi:fucokinase